ncbi:MAG: transposase [Chloroflexi bacterium]|nr:transposase [Chloroflexota bacterium]
MSGSVSRSYTRKTIQMWLSEQHCQTLYIKPGSPWENGFIESFNGKFRAECLNRYSFRNEQEAQELVEQWREEYNHHRPHSALGYLAPSVYAAQLAIPLTPPGTTFGVYVKRIHEILLRWRT